ncbi:hypothetical protein SLEP1_g7320 [Rubroshorea leprosula]|uniref:Uncharacterized protein n=1 Tax=Rubroshorea leprosula TaxID=152421 RepID=A0AAV5HYA4_9ROSI|nr:hypothetical protein SLEP1_g7320 [Rubroshorea leprosula]
MEGSSSSSSTDGSHNPSEKARASDFEKVQKQYEEKMVRIQELKKQIESVKVSLEEKKKNIPVPEETKEAFKSLSQRYESLREEYNVLLAQKSKDHK